MYLKSGLVEAANAAARAKGTYLRDRFFRFKARRGYKRAVVAIAHKIFVEIYHMLSQPWQDLVIKHLDRRGPHRLATISVAHCDEQNGQIVLSGEMRFEVEESKERNPFDAVLFAK